MHFERHVAFQNAYNEIFSEPVSLVNLGRVGLTLTQVFFLFGLIKARL